MNSRSKFRYAKMVTLTETIILSIVQGLTEWLPISSSGHLAITQQLLNIQVPVIFDVCLHLGTLFSVLYFFKRDVIGMLKAFIKLDFKSREGKLVVFTLLGVLPTAIIGLMFRDFIESLFTNMLVVGTGLAITGLFLFVSKLKSGKGKLTHHRSVLIGLAQGIATIPGLSRSGLTISVGLMLGVERETAFKYSFLLSIPTILGAAFLDMRDIEVYQIDATLLLVGIGLSAFLGYLSIKILTKIYQKKSGFSMFAYYCWLLSFLLLAAIIF